MTKELAFTPFGWSYTRGKLDREHPDFPALTPRDQDSDGFLAFLGSGLRGGNKFGGPCVAGIEFWAGETDDRADDYELWAHAIRAQVLRGLIGGRGQSWYIGINGDRSGELELWPIGDGALLSTAKALGLSTCTVGAWLSLSQVPYRRPIAEVPPDQVRAFVNSSWANAYPAYPIEGYCMKEGSIDTLLRWDARNRDEALFREVLDSCHCMFYTTPAENRNLTIISNKLEYADFSRLIEDLRNDGTLDGVNLVNRSPGP